jgi:hypothetical protein
VKDGRRASPFLFVDVIINWRQHGVKPQEHDQRVIL